MNTLSYRTLSVNKANAEKKWLVIDAQNQVLGRLASKVSKLLRGKHKPNFTPHSDCGDNVVLINAGMVSYTGNKLQDKVYIRHTGYPGGQKFQNLSSLKSKGMDKVIAHAVKGMLPKNKLGRAILKNLYIYEGSEHNNSAQKPEVFDINQFK